MLLKYPCLLLLWAFPLSARVAVSILVTIPFKSQFFHLPHVLAMAMPHILLNLAYEEAARINVMPVWASLIIWKDVDVISLQATLKILCILP